MKPKPQLSRADLFRSQLAQILNPAHPFLMLAGKDRLGKIRRSNQRLIDRRSWASWLPSLLMGGLLYLKSTFDYSDESQRKLWVDNPCWLSFCGFKIIAARAAQRSFEAETANQPKRIKTDEFIGINGPTRFRN